MLAVPASLWIALALTLVLATLHLAAPRLRRLPGVPESALGSFAGGISVAYVFVHLLPELAEGNEKIGEALEETVRSTALLDLAIFAVALVGFSVFYGLEHLARRARGHEPGGLFSIHLGAFAIYNGLIAYTMPLRVRTGLDFALLFTAAMGLHYVLIDRGMLEHYPRRFRAWGRYLLAACLLAGWLVAAVAAPTNTIAVSLLTAALGGSILLNVFKEELPSDRAASFGWFLVGVLLYAGLLAVVTALGG